MNKLKKLMIVSLIAVTFIILFALNVNAASAVPTGAGVVDVNSSLNIRKSASSSAKTLGSLYDGDVVTLISKSNGFWYVEYADGKYGYCSDDYINVYDEAIVGYVDTSSAKLNVRIGPSTKREIVGSLEKYEAVVLLSHANGWYKVVYDGNQIGYVSDDYISEKSLKYSSVYLDIVDYKQYDSRWASVRIGSTRKTIAAIGCTTSCIAMCENYRRDKSSITPKTMEDSLSYTSGGALYWPSNYNTVSTNKNLLESIYKLLDKGKPVIVGAKKSNGDSHWIVVTGFTGGNKLEEDMFLINDPGSDERKTLEDFFDEYPKFSKYAYYD